MSHNWSNPVSSSGSPGGLLRQIVGPLLSFWGGARELVFPRLQVSRWYWLSTGQFCSPLSQTVMQLAVTSWHRSSQWDLSRRLMGVFLGKHIFLMKRDSYSWTGSWTLPPLPAMNEDVMSGAAAAILWLWDNKHKQKANISGHRSHSLLLSLWSYASNHLPLDFLLY